MQTLVEDNGEWSGCINIMCGVDPGRERASSDATPIMHGREVVLLRDLVGDTPLLQAANR